MTKKQIKWLLFSLVFVAVCGIGFYLYQRYEADKYSGYFLYTGKGEIDSYQVLAGGKGVIVNWKVDRSEGKKLRKYNKHLIRERRNPTAQNYVFRQNMKLPNSRTLRREPIKEDYYWTLSVYQVQGDTLNREPEIDLLSLGNRYKKGMIVDNVGPVYSYQGKDLLTLNLRPKEEFYTTDRVFLNLQTREIEEAPAFGDLQYPLPRAQINTGQFSKFGIMSIYEINQFSIDSQKLSESNIFEDKNAINLLNKKDSKTIVLNNENTVDSSDRLASVYSLFLPKDYNVYENALVPAELSTDGQEHRVNSKVEFDRYYDIEKAKKIYHLE